MPVSWVSPAASLWLPESCLLALSSLGPPCVCVVPVSPSDKGTSHALLEPTDRTSSTITTSSKALSPNTVTFCVLGVESFNTVMGWQGGHNSAHNKLLTEA